MRCLVSALLTLGLAATVTCHVGRQESLPPNRCLPGQSCFPSRQILREFAATLVGKVYFPSSAEYASFVRRVNNRATRHPAMVVVAEQVEDVQKAMLFARKFQLMVTSSSDTKDPTGRDSYDGSLNINLSLMKSVTSVNLNTTRSEYGEITAQAGATWEEVYQRARVDNKDVVAPNALKSSVGSTVGDGGIGPLVKIYGLVSDNLLEAKVVMADGSLVTVSEYKILQDFGNGLVKRSFDRTLLQAISSGGVGPWGVVVSYTFMMKPAPAGIVRHRLVYRLWQDGDYVGAEVLNTVMGVIGALPQKWGGYYYISGMASDDEANTRGELIVNLFYYGTWKQDTDYDFIDNIYNIDATHRTAFKAVNETGVYEFETHQNNILDFPAGRHYGFNTLLQNIEPAVPNESEKLTEALLFALNSPTVESNYFCTGQIMGGAVENKRQLPRLDLTNPVVRSAYMSLSCQLVYPGRGLDDSFYVDHAMDFIQLLAPFGRGKIRFWSQPDLVNWKQQLYGDMYGKLISTKLSYDVDNYLWCPNCVGSDYRVTQNCNQADGDRKNELLQYGNLLGGYISGQRYKSTKLREQNQRHKARLVYIRQMAVKGNY